MKLSNELDIRIKKSIESDNERALRQLMNKKPTFVIPMHTSNMRMLESDDPLQSQSVRKTIIPEMSIAVNPKGINENKISKHAVSYRLTYNNQAFPLAHVYNGSGDLCLGNIFVPSHIPTYSPQQPIETLFLHNDRHTAHGHPCIPINKIKTKEVGSLLYALNPMFPVDIHHSKWIERDTLWRIGEAVLNSLPKHQAFETMNQIYHIIFNSETHTVGKRHLQI